MKVKGKLWILQKLQIDYSKTFNILFKVVWNESMDSSVCLLSMLFWKLCLQAIYLIYTSTEYFLQKI